MSNPTEEDWKRMQKLVDSFYQRADVVPFRDPVPWKELGLVDYPTVIKNPMDLGTVKKKLKKKQYTTLYAVAEDVRLIWNNCMTYNADGSDFYKLAETLQKKWEAGYTKLLNDIGSTAGSANMGDAAPKASLQDKRNMAKMLYTISKEDLGKVLVDVENKCPAAIKRNASEDELELNIDAISAPCMQEIMAFLQTLKANNNNNKKTAPKAKKAKVATAATG